MVFKAHRSCIKKLLYVVAVLYPLVRDFYHDMIHVRHAGPAAHGTDNAHILVLLLRSQESALYIHSPATSLKPLKSCDIERLRQENTIDRLLVCVSKKTIKIVLLYLTNVH